MTSDPGRDDELANLLRRLGDVEPQSSTTVSDALVDVEHRVRRHQNNVRAGAALLAAAAAITLVAIPAIGGSGGTTSPTFAAENGPSISDLTQPPGSTTIGPGTPPPTVSSTSTPSPHPTKPSSSAVTVAIGPLNAVNAVGCPLTWGQSAGEPWVPAAGPSTALISADPTRLVICSYPGAATGPRPLSAGVSVHHGFAAFASKLEGAPHGELRDCPTGNGVTNYLIRAYYGDGTSSWVTVTGCRGASNGSFSSTDALAPGLASAVTEQGTWGSAYPGDCSTDGARPGRDSALVPGGGDDPPVLGYLCVTSPDASQRSETTLTGDTLAGLVNQLGSIPVSAGAPGCDDASGGPTYQLVLVYAGGENLVVTIVPGCDTGVSNGVVVGVAPDELGSSLLDLSSS